MRKQKKNIFEAAINKEALKKALNDPQARKELDRILKKVRY